MSNSNQESGRPLLSIVLPYVHARQAEHAHNSILAGLNKAEERKIQIIRVRDGCDDRLINVPLNLENTLVLPYNTLTNCGISTPGGIPRAIGTMMARGKWVAYLDEDNTLEPHYIPQLLQVLEKAPPQVLYYWTPRTMFIAGEKVCVDDFESVDKVMLDTNCIVIRLDKFRHCAGAWAYYHAYGDDRYVWHVLQDIKLAFKMTSQNTGIEGAPINYNVNPKNWTPLRAYLRSVGRLK